MLQTCIAPSLLVETICVLSGDHENETSPAGTNRVKREFPVFASQIHMLPSRLAEAISEPSGDHATVQIALICPVQINTLLPVSEFQTCTALSNPADTIYFPSGD